ncbi:hypothetical protein Tco_0273048 [Tanacetum coccineum]
MGISRIHVPNKEHVSILFWRRLIASINVVTVNDYTLNYSSKLISNFFRVKAEFRSYNRVPLFSKESTVAEKSRGMCFASTLGTASAFIHACMELALHSGFHEAYKLHSSTTTPPFTFTNELIHDCNPINTETHHQQTPLPPNAVTIVSHKGDMKQLREEMEQLRELRDEMRKCSRATRIEFPRFRGYDMKGWLFKKGVKEASDTNDNSETTKEFVYKENGLVHDVTVETVKKSFEFENRLVDDFAKKISSTSLLTKGGPFVVNRKVGLADNSFEIGILTKGMVFVKNHEELTIAKFEALNKVEYEELVKKPMKNFELKIPCDRDTRFKLHLASVVKSHVVVAILWLKSKEYELEVVSSLVDNVANICVIGGINFRGDQIDVATVMVVKTSQKVVRSHTIVLEVNKFVMPKKFSREAIEKLLGLKLVSNTQMKSIVEPMSIECGERGILESFNHGLLALDEFNQLRKQGLGLGDNMIAIAKESTEMEECVTRLVLEVDYAYKYVGIYVRYGIRDNKYQWSMVTIVLIWKMFISWRGLNGMFLDYIVDKVTDKGFKITTFVEIQVGNLTKGNVFEKFLDGSDIVSAPFDGIIIRWEGEHQIQV